eukprot:TRINITY_DN9061_c3_g1_i1.p2 TRINITY_DN9061_c3_g1~~TRINITY_DN9061_c3_g1_i1.p2  ORF type:complete len:135 (+),score=0.98 TRINITY_DN9061_c3_g1_i1:100-504(+)
MQMKSSVNVGYTARVMLKHCLEQHLLHFVNTSSTSRGDSGFRISADETHQDVDVFQGAALPNPQSFLQAKAFTSQDQGFASYSHETNSEVSSGHAIPDPYPSAAHGTPPQMSVINSLLWTRSRSHRCRRAAPVC